MTERRKAAGGLDDGTDWERMALQLDRRIAGPEAAEYLDGLPDEDLSVFAEAAAVQRELEEEDEAAGVPGVTPLRRRAPAPRVLDVRWMAAAAVIAGLLLVPATWRASRGGPVRAPAQAVALLSEPSAGLPEGWTDTPPWSVTRSGAGRALTDEARAARVGAFVVDLELAVRAADAERTRELADGAALLLDEANTAGTLAAAKFTEIGRRTGAAPATLLATLEEASEDAALALDADRFALGAWAEAARLAAARRDANFFRSGRTRRTLARAETLLADDEQARTALTAIRASAGSDPPDWPRLTAAASALLAAVGS